MKHPHQNNWLMVGLGLGSSLLVGMTSCMSDNGGLFLPGGGSSGSGASGGTDTGGGVGGDDGDPTGDSGASEAGGKGGSSSSGKGGKGGSSSNGKGGKGGSSGSNAGSGGSASEPSDGGTPGESDAGAAGTTEPGTGGMGGEPSGSGGSSSDPNEGGAGGVPDDVEEPLPLCIFHNAAAPVDGGEGGAPAAPGGVKVGTNPFVGPYLTDIAGLTLYIYGADVPGDCNGPPVSNCTADCTIAWPPFDAHERVLDAPLDESVFGTLDRGDGTFQTTYFGWPLYYYKSDTAPNTINGQGKGKTWYSAEVALPNLMIMRGPVSGGGIKYLSDDRGHTLYSLSGDTHGGSGTQPGSSCTGTCLDSFLPYFPGAVYPVTSIEPHDVALFFRGDGDLQTAYKGAPLYYSKLDLRPGEQNGLSLFGGALVAP